VILRVKISNRCVICYSRGKVDGTIENLATEMFLAFRAGRKADGRAEAPPYKSAGLRE
jgi:hypothetical protein